MISVIGNTSRTVRTPRGTKRKTAVSSSKVRNAHDPFSHSILSNASVMSENAYNHRHQRVGLNQMTPDLRGQNVLKLKVFIYMKKNRKKHN